MPLDISKLRELFELPEETPEEVLARHQRLQGDIEFFLQYGEELHRKYPNRYIAVCDGKLVATAHTLKALLRQLKRKKVPAGEAFIRFIYEQDVKLILLAA